MNNSFTYSTIRFCLNLCSHSKTTSITHKIDSVVYTTSILCQIFKSKWAIIYAFPLRNEAKLPIKQSTIMQNPQHIVLLQVPANLPNHTCTLLLLLARCSVHTRFIKCFFACMYAINVVGYNVLMYTGQWYCVSTACMYIFFNPCVDLLWFHCRPLHNWLLWKLVESVAFLPFDFQPMHFDHH